MLAFLITAGVVALDQITKFFVRLNMQPGETHTLIPYVVQLTYSENTGASFGMLKDARWVFMLFSTVAIVAIIALFIWEYRRPAELRRGKLAVVAFSFILGGGIGNMIDRLFVTNAAGENAVTDMFELLFMNFAIFNVADCFVVIGCIFIIVKVIQNSLNAPD